MPRYTVGSSSTGGTSSAMSENSVVFYDSGGHSHDGINSSLIDTSRYSLWDFTISTIPTTNARINQQTLNINRFKKFIATTVTDILLTPAGITLGENVITGYNIVANSITTDELATNSIKSLNYVGPDSATSGFSTSGSFFKLDSGDIITPGILLQGSTGTLKLKGDILGGKANYSDTTAGFFLGLDGGLYKLHIGDSLQSLRWDGTSLETLNATITGAVITGGIIQTSSSGARVVIANNAINLYAPTSSSNTASIVFNPPTNLFFGVIESTGSLIFDTAAGNYTMGYYYAGGKFGFRADTGYAAEHLFQGSVVSELNPTEYGNNWDSVQFIGQNDGADGAALALRGGTDAGTVQLRVNYNSNRLLLRNYNNSSYTDLQFKDLFLSGSGIQYNGLAGTPSGATANYIGFTWNAPNMYAIIDGGNAVFIVAQGSDRRIKQNIELFEGALNIINNFNPVTFNPIQNFFFENNSVFIPDTESQILGESRVGLIADEVEAVAPWLVVGKSLTNQIQTVDYAGITPILIKAVQELNEKVNQLEALLQ